MSTTDLSTPAGLRPDRPSPFGQVWAALSSATAWLDERGRGAWIALTVAAFFVAPPLGVALLLFALGTGRMFGHRHHHEGRAMARSCGWKAARRESMRSAAMAMRPSGNMAFDSYKAETLRRLEDEQRAFEEFLGRLRAAKDKAEFDQFMDERSRKATDATPEGEAA